MVRRLRILAPILFLPSFVLAGLIAMQKGHEVGMRLRYLCVAMLLVWAVIRVVRTVPVNSATLEWNPEAPPRNWRSLVETTERFHVVAVWTTIIAFLCSLAAIWGVG